MDFLDLVRKAAQERRERERFIIKGGKGSGWFGPPKGTHTAGAKAGAKAKAGKGKKPTQTHMKRAARVNTIADNSPSRLRGIAVSSLLAARGVTVDLRTQYKGVKGTQADRDRLDSRIKILDTELKRRGIKNPANAVRERWPGWKPMEKITLTTGKGTKGKKRKQPPDMSKWSKAQHQRAINELVKKPLKELRRRQDLVTSQRKNALQQLKRPGADKDRLERGLRNLDVMEQQLIAAIDKKEFG